MFLQREQAEAGFVAAVPFGSAGAELQGEAWW